MKINEILAEGQLDEGPIDFAKQAMASIKGIGQGATAGKGVLGKVAGLATGAKAGWQQQGAANKQADLIKSVSSKASLDWAKSSQNIQMSTGNPPVANDAVAWFKEFAGATPLSAPPGTNPAQINQWLQKEISNFIEKNKNSQEPLATNKPQTSAPVAKVETPAQGTVTKDASGKWHNEQGQEIIDPNDIAELEQRSRPGTPEEVKPVVAPVPLPIPLEKLTKEERAELRRQLQVSLRQS